MLKRRKPTPQPPHHFWLDADGCWDCNHNHNGCRNCKRLKQICGLESTNRSRLEKQKLRSFSNHNKNNFIN